ncbi:MAG: HD domain-containing protein [Prevotella sp.]|jgi:HD superfamily phosphohydrolase|nr:HD domain-containing protein [Prevotella sp.]
MTLKKKIINDPVFGFITIPNSFLYDLIQHPILQRLNRIKQMGLAFFVYPGAQHTRLHHSIGAMYLMDEAINSLRAKGHEITNDEAMGALACILLHDVGHGPFSHALEHTLTNGIHHEELSLAFMDYLNKELEGKLDTCIAIFKNEYPKKFLHQLVSGQLDVDRLDYLRRDSFFSGVTEGNIGSARIIKMLDIRNDRLVVEAKGIYSIENFLTSRRLMYWQVYLHKTAVAAERMLIKTLTRAKELSTNGVKLFGSPALHYFLENNVDKNRFENDRDTVLRYFAKLDDNDIWCALKVWAEQEDTVLSRLSMCLINRQLFKMEITNEPVPPSHIREHVDRYMAELNITEYEASYFYSSDVIYTNMYNEEDDSIDILYNDGTIKDISEASDMLNIQLLSKKVEKYYFSYLKL